MADLTGAARPRRKRSIVVNTTMNGVAHFAQVISTLIFFPLLVASFGVAEYGIYVIALSVTSIALMFDFGIGAATIRAVADRLSHDSAADISRLVSTTATLLLGVGVLTATVIAGIALAAGHVFSVTAEQTELLGRLLLIGAAMQLWYWPASTAAHVLQGLQRYDLVARTSVLATLGNVSAIGIVLLSDAGPVALMAAGAAVMVAASLINLATLRAVGPVERLWARPSLAVAREMVATGIPVFTVAVAHHLNREQADRIIIAMALGPVAVAIYEVAAKLSMLIGQVATLPTSAMLPVVSGAAARADREALRGLFLKGGRYITVLVVPLVVTLAVVAGPFVSVWFGEGFEEAVPVAYLLILVQLFFPPLLIGGPILIGTGRMHLWAPRAVFLALANVTISVALVGEIGLLGVALGTFISSLLELPLFARLMLRETGASFGQWIRTAWAGYALLPVAALVAWGAITSPLGESFAGIALAAALAVGAYWLAVYALLLTALERQRLAERIRRLMTERE